MKVVVIVGPVGSSTANYIYNAKKYAAQARSYGANVIEIYSPNATWDKVKAAAQGAKVLIYLGHGNGSPSPYGAWNKYSKDGFGLNKTAGAGNSNTKYWGEWYIQTYLKLAPNAVVILNRLCYASGNSEWGAANPSLSVAKQRIDNYGAGFLRTGAKAVFAEGITNAAFILYGIFKTSRSIGTIFQSSSNWSGARDFQFQSVRNAQFRAWSDPYAPSRVLPIGHRQPEPDRLDHPGQLTAEASLRSGSPGSPGPSVPELDRGFRMPVGGRAEAPVRGWRIPSGAEGCESAGRLGRGDVGDDPEHGQDHHQDDQRGGHAGERLDLRTR